MTPYELLKAEAHLAQAVAGRWQRTPKEKRARSVERAKVRELMRCAKASPCLDCGGVFHPEAMEFDHRPGTYKSFNLSRAVRYTEARVKEELSKCDLVCANCHRVRTFERRR